MGGPDKDARFKDVFEAATMKICVERAHLSILP